MSRLFQTAHTASDVGDMLGGSCTMTTNPPPRILLAEDDRLLRVAGEATLRKRGFSVTVAVDGEDALLKARNAPFDLILLDVMMPKLQGFEVLVQLKADPLTLGVPVIMLSSLGQDADVQEAMNAGAAAYFVKSDLRLNELADKITAVLTGMGDIHVGVARD